MSAITPDTLFRRAFRLTVADKQFGSFDDTRPLSFQFGVQRDRTLTPNNANVLIYNLSADTRAHLEELSGGFGQGSGKLPRHKLSSVVKKKPTKTKAGVAFAPANADGVPVRIEAGYGAHIGQIFFGVLRKVSSWKQGTDWITQISGGDAEHSITTAKISQTFVKGTPITSVVRALVTTLGVGKGGLDTTLNALEVTGLLTAGRTLSKALTMHGDSATELEQLMRSCGFEWHISDGAFYAGPSGTPTFPGEGPLLTPETGLLDTPQIDKNGKLVGRALLNADLLPGRVFRVESSRVTGNFLCSKTQHKGSSEGPSWEVEFVGNPPAPGSKAAILAAALGDTGFKQ
ncbi:MAG: hypothetical protein V4593_08310 [Pseudomonadota bacterium]